MSFLPGFSHGYTSIAWSHSLTAPGKEPFTIRPLSPVVTRTTEQSAHRITVTSRDLVMEVRTGRITDATG
ncbi:MAG: hypothetical protein ACOY4F_13095 [Thermodesulfobacteriota bacterium]|nr:hypothetical protein [Desulfovibrio sp.]